MDYTRNEDKLCYSARGYNRIIDISFADIGPEPLNLGTVKDHLRITFDDDDSYVGMLIKMARSAIEKYTGLSLISKTITLHFSNNEGNFALPYGPVVSITSMKDADNVLITDYETSGITHKYVATPTYSEIRIVYTAGYTFEKIPEDLKLAILHEVAYQYEHRGDEADKEGLSPIAKGYAKMHRRVPNVL